METIREALKKSLDPIPGEVDTLSLPFPYVIRAMALLLYYDAARRTGQDISDEIISCLRNDFNMDSIAQSVQLHSFLMWWLEQAAEIRHPDEDEEEWFTWYDLKGIGTSWNKWAEEERKRRGQA